MKKISSIFLVFLLLALASICRAEAQNWSANYAPKRVGPQRQSAGKSVSQSINNALPIPIDELIITPVVAPFGIVYGASLISLSVVGSAIAAPFVLPSLIVNERREASQRQQYRYRQY